MGIAAVQRNRAMRLASMCRLQPVSRFERLVERCRPKIDRGNSRNSFEGKMRCLHAHDLATGEPDALQAENTRALVDGELFGQIRIGGNDLGRKHPRTRSESSKPHFIAEAGQLSRPLGNTRLRDKSSAALFAPDISSGGKRFKSFANGDLAHFVASPNEILVGQPVSDPKFPAFNLPLQDAAELMIQRNGRRAVEGGHQGMGRECHRSSQPIYPQVVRSLYRLRVRALQLVDCRPDAIFIACRPCLKKSGSSRPLLNELSSRSRGMWSAFGNTLRRTGRVSSFWPRAEPRITRRSSGGTCSKSLPASPFRWPHRRSTLSTKLTST